MSLNFIRDLRYSYWEVQPQEIPALFRRIADDLERSPETLEIEAMTFANEITPEGEVEHVRVVLLTTGTYKDDTGPYIDEMITKRNRERYGLNI